MHGCRLQPKPMVATSREDILAARGVKPCISPNLNILATVEALQARLCLPQYNSRLNPNLRKCYRAFVLGDRACVRVPWACEYTVSCMYHQRYSALEVEKNLRTVHTCCSSDSVGAYGAVSMSACFKWCCWGSHTKWKPFSLCTSPSIGTCRGLLTSACAAGGEAAVHWRGVPGTGPAVRGEVPACEEAVRNGHQLRGQRQEGGPGQVLPRCKRHP